MNGMVKRTNIERFTLVLLALSMMTLAIPSVSAVEGPPPPPILVIQPNLTTLNVGESQTFIVSAIVLGQGGPMPLNESFQINFTSTNLAVGTVSPASAFTVDGNATVTFTAIVSGSAYVLANNTTAGSNTSATVTVNPQYYLTVNTNPAGITTISGSGWYNSGTTANTGTAPSTVTSGGTTYDFSTWQVDGSPVGGNPISVLMNAPHTATAVYQVQAGTGPVNGLTGGPDYMGYTFIDSNRPGGPVYNWIDITATGAKIETLNNTDDAYTTTGIPVGFFFNFYGTDYSTVNVTNNGIIFAQRGIYTNEPINNSPGIHNFIAPFWDDIVTWNSSGPLGAVYYQAMGTAPNRKFVVEWYNNQHFSSSPNGVTFEAILNEGTNNILFQYQDVSFGEGYYANNGSSATVGIEGPLDMGLQYSYNQPAIYPGLAILFKFPQFNGTNLFLSKNAPESKDNGSTMTYSLYYNNFGSIAAQNVVLTDTLPPQVEFISASDGGVFNPVTRNVTWNIGTAAAWPNGRGYENVTVRILQNVAVGTIIQNTARISTTNLEVRYDDNAASAQTRVTGRSLPPNVTVEPNNGGQGTTSVYYGNPINFTYHSCPTATGVDIRIHIDDGGADITGSMAGGPPDWVFTTTFYPRHGHATVTYTVYGCDQTTVGYDIYIDPAGYIYDATTGARIANAVVWLQRPDGAGGWENVPTGQIPPISQPDTNPLITGTDGQYQWNVTPGTYRVHVEAPGYYSADSRVVNIPPPVFDLNVGLAGSTQLTVLADPTRVTVGTPSHVVITVTSNGTAVPGALVNLTGAVTMSNTTGSDGTAHFYSVNAASTGTITVIASKSGFTAGQTTINARKLSLEVEVYDTNGDDRIQRNEAVTCVVQFFVGGMPRSIATAVVVSFFTG